ARFAHVLGLTVGPDLRALTRAEAGRLPSAAAERILNEIVLTREAGRSAAAVRLWDELGLLEVVLPEIVALRGVTQSPFHHHDVYGHTLETMERLDDIVAAPGRWFGLSWESLEGRLDQPVDGVMSRPVALRLGALLHDVAKPETRAVGEEGRVLFWGHTEIGGPVAEKVCARLRCSAAATDLIRAVVERHLDIGFLQHEHPTPPREVVRFLWRSGPWEPEVIMVSAADRLATRGPRTQDASIDAHLRTARDLMDAWRSRQEKGVPPLPLDGEVLMAELDLEPGPVLGRVLREVRLGWEAGELSGRDAALALARERLDAFRAEGSVL
ncbi:MAG: HD domain-containing protein, partial [Thermoleophilia bacterium]